MRWRRKGDGGGRRGRKETEAGGTEKWRNGGSKGEGGGGRTASYHGTCVKHRWAEQFTRVGTITLAVEISQAASVLLPQAGVCIEEGAWLVL